MISEYLRRYMEVAPVALSVVRAAECELFSQQEIISPSMDIGSGDGLFASIAFEHKIDVALDLSPRELELARNKDAYRLYVTANAGRIPFLDDTFQTVISNCVFEHLTNLTDAFAEIYRVLKPGGAYYFTCHSHLYSEYLFYYRLLAKLGLNGIKQSYLNAINGLFKHFNCFHPDRWKRMLVDAGFKEIEYRYYLPKQVESLFDLFLPLAGISYVSKKLTGRWTLTSRRWLHALIGKWLNARLSDDYDLGGALFFIARKGKTKA